MKSNYCACWLMPESSVGLPTIDGSVRPPTANVDRRSPDERCMGSFPSRLRDLQIGWRLDALDKQGGWYAGTVIEVRTP